MDCSICFEPFTPFTKSTRYEIKCPHCQLSSCVKCNKSYLLSSIHEPHCSSCRKTWSVEFMNTNFPKYFMKNTYRANRELVYFKEEETLLYEIQPLAEFRKGMNLLNESIIAKNMEIKANEDNEDQLVRTKREIYRRLKNELDACKKDLETYKRKDILLLNKQVVMKCPISECKGFLDSTFHCGSCNSHVCINCHCNKTENEHKCNSDDVAKITKLNRTTTKPCPKCHTSVFKSDGCDPMFCLDCHTPFSWKTGCIETGISKVIQNSSYVDTICDVICQDKHNLREMLVQDVSVTKAYSIVNVLGKVLDDEESIVFYNSLLLSHERISHMARILPQLIEEENRCEDRINYLIGKLDEKKFKKRLYRYRTHMQQKHEEYKIVQAMVITGNYIFREFNVNNVKESDIQLDNLITLAKEAIKQNEEIYKHNRSFEVLYF